MKDRSAGSAGDCPPRDKFRGQKPGPVVQFRGNGRGVRAELKDLEEKRPGTAAPGTEAPALREAAKGAGDPPPDGKTAQDGMPAGPESLTGLQTPCYILDEDVYRESLRVFRESFESAWGGGCRFGYSIKTNHLRWPLEIAREAGYLAEVVSPDEYAMVRNLGVPDHEIIYNGPQKRETVIPALAAGALVNLDSLEECERVADAARSGRLKNAFAGLRVNFDLESRCPGETTCGSAVGRFGICEENGDLGRALAILRSAGIRMAGLHLHQSSSSRSLGIFRAIAEEAVFLAEKYGLRELDWVDLGGGFSGGTIFPAGQRSHSTRKRSAVR